jgi:hypothetical protein
MNRAVVIAVALVVAVAGGWQWGASGGRRAESMRQAMASRLAFVEARSALLEARLALYSANAGEANRHLEIALTLIDRIAGQPLTAAGTQAPH